MPSGGRAAVWSRPRAALRRFVPRSLACAVAAILLSLSLFDCAPIIQPAGPDPGGTARLGGSAEVVRRILTSDGLVMTLRRWLPEGQVAGGPRAVRSE